MGDEEESRWCVVCGGPVGPDGRTLTPRPPREVPRAQVTPAPAREVEDAKDNLTPVQRFERAIRRRDSATAKGRGSSGKGKVSGR